MNIASMWQTASANSYYVFTIKWLYTLLRGALLLERFSLICSIWFSYTLNLHYDGSDGTQLPKLASFSEGNTQTWNDADVGA